MTDIDKYFGPIQANSRASFELRRGEIHALLGENGAGKSTLMKILYGLITPDGGTISLEENEIRFSSPTASLRSGIGMVHQHFMLVPNLTVAENVAIGSKTSLSLRFRRDRIEDAVAAIVERLRFDLDPRAVVGGLPVEVQQRVEIVRLLYRGARTLILDEPTAALGSAHVDGLLATLVELRAAGHSIVLVTHKLGEVMAIADRATVLRSGTNVATFDQPDFDPRSFTEAMFEQLPAPHHRSPRPRANEVPALQVESLHVRSDTGAPALRGLDLEIKSGEIVGLAGVAENGQTELVGALSGVLLLQKGCIRLAGVDATNASPRERRFRGLRTVPEDRHRSGVVLQLSIADNLALTDVPSGGMSRYGLLRRRQIVERAKAAISEFGIKPAEPTTIVGRLSGGNQQKVVLARELAGQPKVLVAASPTRGLDLAAASSVHEHLERAADSGCAVLVISPDLDELLAVADRIAVIFKGRIVLDMPRSEVDGERLGRAMVGVDAGPEERA
jgi:ABC-type uncharacterized transport system ATPase subunit